MEFTGHAVGAAGAGGAAAQVKRRASALLVLLAMLTACAKPIPPEHRDLVGTWEAPQLRLAIAANGRLDYERKTTTGNVSIDAPIQELRADGFSAGLGPLTTQFRIDRAPHVENGVWTMTVDGVVLRRRADGDVPQVER